MEHPSTYSCAHVSHVPAIPLSCAGYLGEDRSAWAAYDAVELLRALPAGAPRPPLLVDTGSADKFLAEQLKPEALEAAVRDTGYPNATLRIQVGGAAANAKGGHAGSAWGDVVLRRLDADARWGRTLRSYTRVWGAGAG